MPVLEAWITNLGKYNENVLACEPLKLPASALEREAR